MKVIHVNTPLQHANTIDPQIIDGKMYHWVVKSECMKLGETFQQWWERKQELMKQHSKIDLVEGIFFYDVQPVGPIVGNPNEGAMIIRYEWIKVDSGKNVKR